ncbi:hypothetical protein BaRGS_00024504, partial [Batillaria attramentaria]
MVQFADRDIAFAASAYAGKAGDVREIYYWQPKDNNVRFCWLPSMLEMFIQSAQSSMFVQKERKYGNGALNNNIDLGKSG